MCSKSRGNFVKISKESRNILIHFQLFLVFFRRFLEILLTAVQIQFVLENLSRTPKDVLKKVMTVWEQEHITYPGRTFLGKRRYFSGIVVKMPLTPLTHKQNAVNAFIPTRTPLTPLAFRLNAVNAAVHEKTCVHKKSEFFTP